MTRAGLGIVVIAAAGMAGASGAVEFLAKSAAGPDGPRAYRLYVPADYSAERAWPLIVFLHGLGECGDDNLKQTEVGIGPAIRKHPERFPALVLMPQCPEGRFWDAAIPHIEAAMTQVQAEYRVDPARRYLTGLSMGGYATWAWGAAKTDTFAALMPICGGSNLLEMMFLSKVPIKQEVFGPKADRAARLARVPIFAFHGADDTTVPPQRSRDSVAEVRAAGGNVQYMEFPDTGHDSWVKAYDSAEALDWLFAQRLPARE